jgi:hypothetical protein
MSAMIEIGEDGFQIDAKIIAEGLGIEAALVPARMREGAITSLCERGVDADAGSYRLTFFHKGTRLRLVIDEAGNIKQRSVLELGERPAGAPPAPRRNPA